MSNQIVILSDGQAFNTAIYTVATITYGGGHISVNMNDNTCIIVDTGDTRMTAVLIETVQTLVDHGIPMVLLSDGQAYNKDEYILARMLYRNDEIKATFVRQNEPGYSYIIHIDPEGKPMDVMKRNLDFILNSLDEDSSSSDEESSSSDEESSSSDDEPAFDFAIPELESSSEDSDEAREQLLEELEADELQDEELYDAEAHLLASKITSELEKKELQVEEINNFINQTVDAATKAATSVEIEQPDSS